MTKFYKERINSAKNIWPFGLVLPTFAQNKVFPQNFVLNSFF